MATLGETAAPPVPGAGARGDRRGAHEHERRRAHAGRPGLLDRLLGLFSEAHAGEGARVLLMLVNVFLILVSYYVIKTVREPLILSTEVPRFLQALGIKGPAEVKAYAAAGQALVLMAFVPAYSWFASRASSTGRCQASRSPSAPPRPSTPPIHPEGEPSGWTRLHPSRGDSVNARSG